MVASKRKMGEEEAYFPHDFEIVDLKRSRSESMFLPPPMEEDVRSCTSEPPVFTHSQSILTQLALHRQRLRDIGDILINCQSQGRTIHREELVYYEEGIMMLLQGLRTFGSDAVDHSFILQEMSILRDDALEIMDWIDQLKNQLAQVNKMIYR